MKRHLLCAAPPPQSREETAPSLYSCTDTSFALLNPTVPLSLKLLHPLSKEIESSAFVPTEWHLAPSRGPGAFGQRRSGAGSLGCSSTTHAVALEPPTHPPGASTWPGGSLAYAALLPARHPWTQPAESGPKPGQLLFGKLIQGKP